MKKLMIIGLLLTGISGSAFSMGHPHNMFAARKQLRAKTSTSVAKAKPTVCLDFQHMVHLTKTAFGESLVGAFTQLRLAQPH
jgi:hypothetical protein